MSTEDGLVYAVTLDGKGGGRPMTWPDIESWNSALGLLWIHLDS